MVTRGVIPQNQSYLSPTCIHYGHRNSYYSLQTATNVSNRWYALKHYFLCWMTAKYQNLMSVLRCWHLLYEGLQIDNYRQKVGITRLINFRPYSKICHLLIFLNTRIDEIEGLRSLQRCLSGKMCLSEGKYWPDAKMEYRQVGPEPFMWRIWSLRVKIITFFAQQCHT